MITSLTMTNFAAWVAEIRLQAGALGLTTEIDDPIFNPDPLLIPTLTSFYKGHTPLDTSRRTERGYPCQPGIQTTPTPTAYT